MQVHPAYVPPIPGVSPFQGPWGPGQYDVPSDYIAQGHDEEGWSRRSFDQANSGYKRERRKNKTEGDPQGPATIPVAFRRVGTFPQEGLERANHKGMTRLLDKSPGRLERRGLLTMLPRVAQPPSSL